MSKKAWLSHGYGHKSSWRTRQSAVEAGERLVRQGRLLGEDLELVEFQLVESRRSRPLLPTPSLSPYARLSPLQARQADNIIRWLERLLDHPEERHIDGRLGRPEYRPVSSLDRPRWSYSALGLAGRMLSLETRRGWSWDNRIDCRLAKALCLRPEGAHYGPDGQLTFIPNWDAYMTLVEIAKRLTGDGLRAWILDEAVAQEVAARLARSDWSARLAQALNEEKR